MKKNSQTISTLCLLSITLLSGLALTSTKASADNDSVTDDVEITVPVACTMSGTGNNTHTATLNPGTYSGASGSEYENGIGKTTLTTKCNDNNGFSIYAVGFTNDEAGNNTLIGNTTSSTINTKAYESTDTQSNWSMKVTKVENPSQGDPVTYNPDNMTITNSFTTWHAVPDEYTQVAEYKSTTGPATTDTTLGAKVETTYAAFVSQDQPADTYTGQVKYVMVHPYNATAPTTGDKVNVIYDGNGETFQGGASTNQVVYAVNPMYVANTPEIIKSPNIDDNGNKTGGIAAWTDIYDKLEVPGASKLKVVINYDLTTDNNTWIDYTNAALDGWSSDYVWQLLENGTSGSQTITIEGNAITFYTSTESASDNYGFYAQIYPIYATEQTDTSPSTDYSVMSVDTGAYATTTNWYGSWYTDINNTHYDFMDESEVMGFLASNTATLSGQTVTLMRGLTFTEAYTRASKSQSGGYYTEQDLNKNMCQTIAITQNQTLKDTRDNNTYLAGKLKDGNCWMLDNMALDLTDSTTLANVTEQNTNASNTSLAYLKGTSTGTTSDQYATSAISDWSTNPTYGSSYSFSDPLIATYGNCHNTSHCVSEPEAGKWTKDSVVVHYGVGSGKIGVYYNYCAASAGSYCYGNGASEGASSGNATEDICPKNWRMPTGGSSSGEFFMLQEKYNSTKVATNTDSLQYNLSTPLSGVLSSGAASQNDSGYFWSSTNVAGSMFGLMITPSGVYQTREGRFYGYSLRCLVGD